MTLEELQQRLEQHFSSLRDQRASTSGKQPIFALEHGLDTAELVQLRQRIHTAIASGYPAKRHSLTWIVYAAEMGYRYSGDEYWQTFNAETPLWTSYGSRRWIRSRFEEFHAAFGAAKPTGRWAEQFTNICWPITHAILPKDLQRQLAKVLYDCRHAFTRALLASPENVGALIAARSWNASSRFRKLAEQPLLLGQIATALLLNEQNDASSLILPSTLRRIATDLEREREARAWLLGARQHATSTRFRGISTTSRQLGVASRPQESASDHPSDLGVEPRLILQPSTGRSYEVLAEIPNLSPLLARFPDLSDILAGSRCIVSGASGAPLWKGRVLRSAQLARLLRWPRANEPLFRFEQTNPTLEYVLRTESFRRAGNQWLFRVASDRRGYEMRSMTVRAGATYLLLRTEPFQEPAQGTDLVNIECQEVRGLILEVPPVITSEVLGRLRVLGLSVTRSVEVWPAGTPPAAWDGEGRAEWLASDTPILAIRSDHELHELTVVIDEDEWSRVQFSNVPAGKTFFIELRDLSVGVHRAIFRTRPLDRSTTDTAFLQVAIREPSEWTPGFAQQGAFVILLDPPVPSLEQLWEGRVAMEVHGPAGRSVTSAVALKARQSDQPLVHLQLPPLAFPITAQTWQQHFGKHVRKSKAVEERYDLAHSCLLEFTAEELGRYAIECEREFTPIRWALRRAANCYELTVINYTSEDGPFGVTFYDAAHPATAQLQDTTVASYRVPHGGGLYAASSERYTASILVPPFKVQSFQDLRAKPTIDSSGTSTEQIVHLLSTAEIWTATRFSGAALLASIRRRNDIVDALLRGAVGRIVGEKWAHEENIFRGRSDPGALSRLCDAISRNRTEKSIGALLERDVAILAGLPVSDRVKRFTGWATKFLAVSDTWICEYALRLSSGCVTDWAGDKLPVGIDELRRYPALLKAARATVLIVAGHIQQSATEVGPVYGGWRWE